MASICCDPDGKKRVSFRIPDGSMQAIRLGKVPMEAARKVKEHIEHLLSCCEHGTPVEPATIKWAQRTTAKTQQKLVRWGLVDFFPREPEPMPVVVKPAPAVVALPLKAFLGRLIDERRGIKEGTRNQHHATLERLVSYFGADRNIRTIGETEAEQFRETLAAGDKARKIRQLARATLSKTVKNCRMLWAKAIKETERKDPATGDLLYGERLEANVFKEVKAGKMVNKERKQYIPREIIQRVLDACPSIQWKLAFAFARFGGLRTPSETVLLTWGDITWLPGKEFEQGTMRIHSPKTEAHEDGGDRHPPVFPELIPFLKAAWAEAEAEWQADVEAVGGDPRDVVPLAGRQIVTIARGTRANLRTHALRIIASAGIAQAWPKIFQNLRASAATDIRDAYGEQAATEWLGHTEAVAKQSYWQVTPETFQAGATRPSGAMPSVNPETARKVTRPAASPSRRSVVQETDQAAESASDGLALRSITTDLASVYNDSYPARIRT